MPDSRDSASQRVKGRMPWDDDVEVHDLDPALDLDVFADDDLGAFAPAPQQEETSARAARPPHPTPPLPEVVSDEDIAVPERAPVIVRFPRTATTPDRHEPLESAQEDPPPSYARTDVDLPRQPSQSSAVRPGTDAPRRSHLPLVAAGVLVIVAIGGGTYHWWQRATPSLVAPASVTASRLPSPGATGAAPASSGAASGGHASSERVNTPLAKAQAPRAAPRSAGAGPREGRAAPPPTSVASSMRSPAAPNPRAAVTVDGAVATAGRAGVLPAPSRPAVVPSARPPKPATPPRDANGAVAGWLRVDAASELQLTVDGVAVGSTRQAPLLLAAGTHNVELASDRAGVRTATRVTVAPGQVAVVPITLPEGTLSVTAQPDADVFVDGQPAGRTPVNNVALTVGVRRILVRHPELGERSYEIVVREGRQTQLSVDLRPR